jgi:hypothetical protein
VKVLAVISQRVHGLESSAALLAHKYPRVGMAARMPRHLARLRVLVHAYPTPEPVLQLDVRLRLRRPAILRHRRRGQAGGLLRRIGGRRRFRDRLPAEFLGLVQREPAARGEGVAAMLAGVLVVRVQVFGVLLLTGEELAAALAVEERLELVVEGVALQRLLRLQELTALQADHLTFLHITREDPHVSMSKGTNVPQTCRYLIGKKPKRLSSFPNLSYRKRDHFYLVQESRLWTKYFFQSKNCIVTF